jgi:hypothetical protein
MLNAITKEALFLLGLFGEVALRWKGAVILTIIVACIVALWRTLRQPVEDPPLPALPPPDPYGPRVLEPGIWRLEQEDLFNDGNPRQRW